jgi:hypothetical protein
MSTAPPATSPPAVEFPPSLKRRGPACVELRATDGSPARLTTSGYQLRATRYNLRVRMPAADGSGRVGLLEAEMDDALHVLAAPACVPLKDGLELTVRFKPRLVGPLPYKTVIIINSRAGPDEEPVALAVPVTVWPSLVNQLTWMFSFGAPLVLAKLVALSNQDSGPLLGTAVAALQNFWTWVWLFLLFCGVLLALRVAGWLWICLGWRE